MSDNFKFAQLQEFTLAGSGVALGDSSMVLTSFKDIDGTNLAMTSFGTVGFGTIEPGSGTQEEQISFTGITQNGDGTATLTGIKTVLFLYPYTQTANFAKSHGGGTTFVISNTSGFYNELTSKDDDETVNGLWTFTQLPESTGGNATDPTQLITYAQALALATGTASINRVVVAGTAGATITIGQTVYFDEATARWKLTDADTAATVNNVIKGIAQGAGTNGNPITSGVLLFGMDSNQSGLTPGATYYFGNTAGALSATPGTVEVTAGQASSATTIIFYSQFNQQITEDQQDALVGASGSPSASNLYETQNDTSNGSTETATTISFTASTKTIADSGNGFVTAGFLIGTSIAITGSASNNGTFTIVSVAAGAIVVAETLVNESAGATVVMTTVKVNKLVRYNAAGTIPGVPATTDVQTFTGNGTWTKPTGAKYVMVECVGGGASGGGGAGSTAGQFRLGGTGGGGGALSRKFFNPSDLTSTVAVTVGAATTGGAAGSSGNGSNGSAGNASTFGGYLAGYGGGAGFGGTQSSGDQTNTAGGGGGGTGAAGATGAGASVLGGAPAITAGVGGAGGQGGGSSIVNGSAVSGKSAEFGGGGGGGCDDNPGLSGEGGSSIYGAAGGGGGGSMNSSNTEQAGGAGGAVTTFVAGGGGTGGTTNGGAGGAGAAGDSTKCGQGGGGGGSQDTGTGGVGGAGGIPGGGGGGGGAGTTTGAAGGAGARGEVRVVTYF